jgi:hypothetical protein
VILYGNRSSTYVKAPNETRRAVEMELKSHGVSFEMPRIGIVDPVGLDVLIRVFRAERPGS